MNAKIPVLYDVWRIVTVGFFNCWLLSQRQMIAASDSQSGGGVYHDDYDGRLF
jgi:hypothetical protein